LTRRSDVTGEEAVGIGLSVCMNEEATKAAEVLSLASAAL